MKTKTPENINQYGEHYSDDGLFSKISNTFKKAGLKVIYYALILYYVLKDEHTSLKHKGIILGALGYFILPVDLIPDFIPVAGYTDDLAALAACISTIKSNITPRIERQARMKLRELFGDVDEKEVDKYNDWE